MPEWECRVKKTLLICFFLKYRFNPAVAMRNLKIKLNFKGAHLYIVVPRFRNFSGRFRLVRVTYLKQIARNKQTWVTESWIRVKLLQMNPSVTRGQKTPPYLQGWSPAARTHTRCRFWSPLAVSSGWSKFCPGCCPQAPPVSVIHIPSWRDLRCERALQNPNRLPSKRRQARFRTRA